MPRAQFPEENAFRDDYNGLPVKRETPQRWGAVVL